jgi:hypothetical protein
VIINAKNLQSDNIFTPIDINSAYEFIEKFYNLSLNIPYNKTEEEFLLQLLSYIHNSSFDFNRFVKKHFNFSELTNEYLLNKWTSPDITEFDRWLLKHYYLQNLHAENSFLTGTIKECLDYSSLTLFREIALSIFNHTSDSRLIDERNNLLHLLDKQYQLADSDILQMKEKILKTAESDTYLAISLCSGRFDFEKELIVSWYSTKNLYPDLLSYAKNINLDSWVNAYIQAYKRAKIEDRYIDEIKSFIAEKNANEKSFYEWYHSVPLSSELLATETADKTYCIDGLGIEYMSLIKFLLESNGYRIDKFKIARTSLLSNTEYNRFGFIEKISDLDSFIHGNLYQYPQTIRREIDLIKSIFEKIFNQTPGTTDTTIVIFSNHGSTALSRLVEAKRYAAKPSHEGRYIKVNSTDTLEDPDYISYKNGADDFKVALTHASLNAKPDREVYGGCTPEEVLVPFIRIFKSNTGFNVTNLFD